MKTTSLFLACALLACNSQPSPLRVLTTSPADGAAGVAVGTGITATFDAPLSAASVSPASFQLLDASGAAVAGQASVSGAIATFTPGAALAASAAFHATLTTAIRAEDGAALAAAVSWSFSTAAPQPPGIPQSVTATGGDTTATVSWAAVATATSYDVYWSTSAGVTKANHLGVLPSTSTSVTHTGLTNGATVHYVVTALNAAGESAESAEVSATPELPGPAAVPTGLHAAAQDGAVQLSWTSAANATSYKVYWSNSTGVSKTAHSGVLSAAATQTTHGGLTNGVAYYYVVTGMNSGGESAESAEASATPAAAAGAPSPPASLTATAQDGAAVLTWPAAANATSYNLYWSANATVSKAGGSPIIGVTSGYVHSGLTNGVAYSWIVTASDGIDESSASPVAHASPASTTAPVVRAAWPSDGDVGVPVGSAITVTFSKAMLATSLTSGSVALAAGAAPVAASVSVTGSTATLTPSAPLSLGTTR